MIHVTLSQVIPQPRHTIVVLHDAEGRRLLPLRLLGREEYLLAVHFLASSHPDAFASDPSLIPVAFTEQLLHAIEESIEAVHIDALQNPLLPYATVRLRLAASLHEIKTRVGVALFVAQQVHCPILVSENLLSELAISPAPDTESQEQQLTRLLTARLPLHPRNLDFQDGTNGWSFAEGPSQHFDYGVALPTAAHPTASVFLKTKPGGSKGKGSVGQAFLADDYRGKRLRLSGLLKTEQVEGATGVFLQAEGASETLRSANMQQQPLQGTHDWTPCALEIDVPTESISLALGLMLLGMGQVWLTDVRLEVVGESPLSPH